MNRRDALQAISLMFGSTIVGSQAFLSGCATSSVRSRVLLNADVSLLNEVSETLLPATDTPGAREADVGSFMNTIVSDYYSIGEQATFLGGIDALKARSDREFGRPFSSLATVRREQLLLALEKETRTHYREESEGDYYYMMIKQLAIWGYLSSEVVAKNAFEHLPVPGKYKAIIDYTPGDKLIYSDDHLLLDAAITYARRSLVR